VVCSRGMVQSIEYIIIKFQRTLISISSGADMPGRRARHLLQLADSKSAKSWLQVEQIICCGCRVGRQVVNGRTGSAKESFLVLDSEKKPTCVSASFTSKPVWKWLEHEHEGLITNCASTSWSVGSRRNDGIRIAKFIGYQRQLIKYFDYVILTRGQLITHNMA
jgi:hypothetical protein